MTEVPAIYLCTTGDIAGPGEDVETQTTLVARILEKLGYLLISDNEHYHLWAMRPVDMPGGPPTGPTRTELEAPIYLCGMDDIAGPGVSEDRLMQRMGLLMDILHKLGWALASGVVPRLHEL